VLASFSLLRAAVQLRISPSLSGSVGQAATRLGGFGAFDAGEF